MVSEVEELVELAGFTEYQKSVYEALYRLGRADVKALAQESSVPKPKVYSVLEFLHGKGFVVLEDEEPKTYSVNSPETAFKQVLDEKRSELEEMQDLVRKAEEERPGTGGDRFLKIMKGRETVLEFLADQLRKVEDEYVTVGRFVSSYTPLQPIMKEKDVDMRFIGPEGHSKDYVVEKYRNMGVGVRTVEMEEIPFRFSIYDNKRLALTLSGKEDGYTTVWTNYPSMVKNMREFFRFYWETT